MALIPTSEMTVEDTWFVAGMKSSGSNCLVADDVFVPEHRLLLVPPAIEGSYGTERLTFYQMAPEMGPPATTAWEYPMADDSWEAEFAEFLEDIRLQRQPSPGLTDAQAALRVIERIYQESEP